MINQTMADIVTPELEQGAIYNNEYKGFRDDYLVLHCLLRKYKPKSVFEIGTNMGVGTNIICNAVPKAKVYSLDLPTELAHISLQHPISEGKGDKVGSRCTFPFTQLRGDSMTFDYEEYPCEAYYIDGEHDFDHPCAETYCAMMNHPKLIIWHDADIPDVYNAIIEASEDAFDNFGAQYDLYRVTDTRIAYAVKEEVMKYSKQFERDFRWLLSMRHKFSFDGSDGYYNRFGEPIVQHNPKGASAKEAFHSWDSRGVIVPTKHPNMLHALLKAKGSANLHIKMYAEDRANGRLPGIEFTEWCKQYNAPDWFVTAVENQKRKYY